MTTPDLTERFIVTLDGQDFKFVPVLKFVYAMTEIDDTMAKGELSGEDGAKMMTLLCDGIRSATRRDHAPIEVEVCMGEMTFTEIVTAVRDGLERRSEASENFPETPPVP